MPQPLENNDPCFYLCLYGTDNKFTSQDVLNRRKCICADLNDHDIKVSGIPSDGDSRLLKAMRKK